MQCVNCPKTAIYAIRDGNAQFPLCLDCYIKFEDVVIRKNEMYERQINFWYDQMDFAIGLPSAGPRFPERPHTVHVEKPTLNNISVSDSQIGVLNTGAVHAIDSTLTVLNNSHSDRDLASFIKSFTERVISSKDLSNDQKNEIVEILNSLSQEAVMPRKERKYAVAKALITRLKEIFKGIKAFGEIWSKAEQLFRDHFESG